MQRDHALEKRGLGVRDILDRLPGHRIGQEPDEVAGMTGLEGNAHLALRLEAANARPVAGARIDDDEWTLVRIDLDALRRHDAYQRVVHWPRQLAAVHDEFAAELQHMRRSLCGMLPIALAALLQDIQKKEPALARINPIGPCIPSDIGCPLRGFVLTFLKPEVFGHLVVLTDAFGLWT